jgi:hypothetical protein
MIVYYLLGVGRAITVWFGTLFVGFLPRLKPVGIRLATTVTDPEPGER